MTNYFRQLDLTQNPFPPAASGLGGILHAKAYLPQKLINKIEKFYNDMSTGDDGVKLFPIIGNYGSGKTAMLSGYLRFFFEERNIKVIYFDNPGVEFYDLADTLMRSLGRYEFAKAIWEMVKPYLEKFDKQPKLFEHSFDDFLTNVKNNSEINRQISIFQKIIVEDLELTKDEEVAAKLGKLVIETKKKSYFDAKDFESNNDSLVPQKQEVQFFSTIVKAIVKIYNVAGVAFLIDEFEEIAISEAITRQKKYSYLTTLRRLIDFAVVEKLWIAVSMTDSAKDIVVKDNPALWERFSNSENSTINLEPFDEIQIKEWLIWWLNRYRIDKNSSKHYNSIFPFPEKFTSIFTKDAKRCIPRKLVKSFFQILADAKQEQLPPDKITIEFMESVVDKLFPIQEIEHEL